MTLVKNNPVYFGNLFDELLNRSLQHGVRMRRMVLVPFLLTFMRPKTVFMLN
ncbi:MAG: hypothetical protein V4539_08105 [Bacteroidota bacterium]